MLKGNIFPSENFLNFPAGAELAVRRGPPNFSVLYSFNKYLDGRNETSLTEDEMRAEFNFNNRN